MKPHSKQKVQGIYYSPQFIARYIVQQTLGKRLAEGADPYKIRVLDPACGDGVFLIAAFDVLDAFIAQRGRPEHQKDASERRCYILQNNLYGVDLDPQAIEVAQLNLLLRAALERGQLDMLEHLKTGNSLIDNPTIAGDIAFNWQAEFPEVMAEGGFDIVVGNPPYRRERDYKNSLDEIARTPFGSKYRAPRMDLWYYFVHRGLEVLKPEGLLSFITNAYWTAGAGAEKLIAELKEKTQVEEIFYLDRLRVFEDVSGHHMIFRLAKSTTPRNATIKLVRPARETSAEPFFNEQANVLTFEKAPQHLFINGRIDIQPSAEVLLEKLNRWQKLGEMGSVRQGIAENPASINRKTKDRYNADWEIGEGVFTLTNTQLNKLNLPEEEKEILRPYHDLSDLGRYFIVFPPSLTLIYATEKTYPDVEVYPTLKSHLERFKPIMDERRETKSGKRGWWQLHWPRDEQIWQASKILAIQMGERPQFVPATQPVYVSFSVNVFIPHPETKEHLYYLTAILNSKLLWEWYQHYAKRRGIGLEINGNTLKKTPIRTINFDDSAEKEKHDRLVKMVEDMLRLKQQHAAAEAVFDDKRHDFARKIERLDREIDALVYELYGLTGEEIKIVEGADTPSA